MDRAPLHLHPTVPLAPRALLPGDPGRALALAQTLLVEPRMFNHHRGLWGYTGAARADGEPLTIQATGMGGPSAAIVLEELADLGLQHAVRVGTCGALAGGLALGALIAVTEAVAADGASRALGAGAAVNPDQELTLGLAASADHVGTVVSTDLFYDPDPSRARAWTDAGALAVEMEAAALMTVGERRGVAVGCLVVVSDSVAGGGTRIGEHELEAAALRMAEVAVGALRPVAADVAGV